MEILIIKTGALGDVIRTSFIAQFFKAKYNPKHTKICWITDIKAKPFFINNAYVDEIIAMQDREKIEELKKKFFNLIINLEEGVEECRLASSLKSEKLIGAFLNQKKEIDYTKESEYWFDMSLISKKGKKQADILKEKNQKTHRQIISEIVGIKDYNKYEPFLRLTKYQRDYSADFLRRYNLSRNDLIIGINTGSADRWPKELSIEKTSDLINKIYKEFKNSKILLFGGPNEIERNRKIIAKSNAPLIDTGTGNNLMEFPALISLCNLFITSDTLGLHIALALKRKTIALFGPTSSSEISLYGLGKKVIAKSNCLCCYKKDCKSMIKINVNEIIQEAKKLLNQKITILITAFKEPNVKKAIEASLNQETKYKYDVIISAPDKETQDIVRHYMKKHKNLSIFPDPGKGKSFALNLAFSEIGSDILILTDGDVHISNNVVEDMVNLFQDPEVGCVSGRPTPQESKNTKFGYWANFLFQAAHVLRDRVSFFSSFIECSGYLFAFRKKIISKIPTDVAEDTIIPYFFWEKGYKIAYAKNARVYVKNPDNIKDWIKQKLRTHKSHGKLGLYADIITTPKVKSFKTEIKGISWLLSYPANFKEFLWSVELAFARFYTWSKFFVDTNIFHKTYNDAWERIESTK